MGQQCCKDCRSDSGTATLVEKELQIERLKLDAERRELDLQRQLLEAKQQLEDNKSEAKLEAQKETKKAEAQDGDYLTMSTIERGMGVRVTDSKTRLQAGCQASRLSCNDQRVMLLNEAGVVMQIDPSDNTAEVNWAGLGKKGYMPVDCLVRCDAARAAQGSSGGSGEGGDMDVSAVDLLRVLAALAGAAGDAGDAPERVYVASEGFHLHSDLKSIKVDPSQKRATCVANVKATVYTEEVVTQNQPCEFLVKVGDADKGVAIGVTKKVPNGYSSHLLGESGFEGTIGALMSNVGGVLLHEGNRVGPAPTLADGDIVGVRVQDGKIFMVKNGAAFMDFQASGPIRFGVSLCEPGQTATIVESSQGALSTLSAGELKAGRRVCLPSGKDERVKSMRVRWNASMLPHCGQVGEVLEVSERSAKVSVGGTSFHWDLEVFDAEQKRYSPAGRDLQTHTNTSTTCVCNVCRARIPKGSQTFRCESEDYDVCEYCNGRPTLPEAGSKVIRGPTWKWGSQDGQPYAEGTVCPPSDADVDGWFSVQWASGEKNRYRGPPFQDVVLARENGLKGSKPFEDNDDTAGMDDLLRALGTLARLSSSSQDHQELSRTTYVKEEGWHFYDKLKSILVDDTRKVAKCKQTRDATVVTEEVFDAEGSFTFSVKVCCASGTDSTPGPITVGIVDDKPTGFSTHVIGNAGFKGCIGAMCMTEGGAIVHEGKVGGDAPGVGDGDIVSVRVHSGSCEWSLNGVKFHDCTIRGSFRFGVSLLRMGQSVEIHSAEAAPLDLNLGSVLHVTWGTQLKVSEKDKNQLLGKGAFGETWKGKLGDQEVAVKLLKKEKLSPELRDHFAVEVKALAGRMQPGGETHPYVQKVIAIEPDKYAVVTEYLPRDLCGFLKTKKKQLTFQNRALLARQIASGMAWLAERQFIHRNLKMQNILIDKKGAARIADFSLARPVTDIQGQVAGTLLYLAPECFDGHFSQKSDVYSYAYVARGIFTGAELDIMSFLTACKAGKMADKLEGMLVEAIKRGDRPDVPSSVHQTVSTQIKACWHKDPIKRPTFESISSDLGQLVGKGSVES